MSSAIIPVAIGALVEMAKLGVMTYFQAMRMAGKTPEEIDVYYNEQKALFQTKDPNTIPIPNE